LFCFYPDKVSVWVDGVLSEAVGMVARQKDDKEDGKVREEFEMVKRGQEGL
jgi:hypothetical protein